MRPTPRRHIDELPSYADASFDPLALARAAADLTLAELLEPHRAHRLELMHARDPDSPDFAELLDLTRATLWPRKVGLDARAQLIAELAREGFVDGLVALSADARASPRVRAVAEAALVGLGRELERGRSDHDRVLARRIARWLERGEDARAMPSSPPPAPPGGPIGAAGCGGNYAPWPMR